MGRTWDGLALADDGLLPDDVINDAGTSSTAFARDTLGRWYGRAISARHFNYIQRCNGGSDRGFDGGEVALTRHVRQCALTLRRRQRMKMRVHCNLKLSALPGLPLTGDAELMDFAKD